MPGRVTEHRENPGLVERHPVLHAIAECVGHYGSVVSKNFGEVAIGPSAGILERLRQIPMIERHPRLDVPLEHLVDDAVVEVEALLINGPLPSGMMRGHESEIRAAFRPRSCISAMSSA